MDKNPYLVLSLSEDASYEQIKNRYRHLTKCLHPDKQPLENYQMSKKHFEEIDKAYKSIYSALRRYVFLQFGGPGIHLLDTYSHQFLEFQEQNLTHALKLQIKQKIIFMLQQQFANGESDKNKINNRTVVNLRKVVLDANVPEIQKCDFGIQIPLPEYRQITSSFSVNHSTTHITRDPKSELQFGLNVSKRIYSSVIITSSLSVDNQNWTYDMAVEKIVGTSLHLRLTPLILTNGKMQMPRFGFDKSFNGFSVSGVTDFQHANLQISTPNKDKIHKSLKFIVQRNGLAVVPRVEYDLNGKIKIFAQFTGSFQKSADSQNLDIRFGLIYGYRLKIMDQFNLQLASHVGFSNYIQVSILTPKFKVNVPILNDAMDRTNIQLLKLSIFLGVYLVFEINNFLNIRNKKQKKRLLKVNFNRLTDVKSQLVRLNTDCQAVGNESRIKEAKLKGLVILKAFIGSKESIRNVKSFIHLQKQKFRKENVLQQFQEWRNQEFKCGNIEDELFDITNFIQSKIIGATLQNFKTQHSNPCIREQDQPQTYIFYSLRGQKAQITIKPNQILNIGCVITKNSFINSLFQKIISSLFY